VLRVAVFDALSAPIASIPATILLPIRERSRTMNAPIPEGACAP